MNDLSSEGINKKALWAVSELEPRFAKLIIAWQQQQGRHHLPWQHAEAYAVWVSEIMLQQTQVSTVLNYFPLFLARFPTLEALANAPLDAVLAVWSGLGYYSRARHLHRAARMLMERFAGRYPCVRTEIETLPGVGRSTAAAIAVFAFGQREAILDGNVKRILTRVFALEGVPTDKRVEKMLWEIAERLLPQDQLVPYTQGLMDLGALICRRSKPLCEACPLVNDCLAHRTGRVASLPTARRKKPYPQRKVIMLLAKHAGKVYLERRPAYGIWGGLLSLPECAHQNEVQDWLKREGEGDILAPWPEIEHCFTHYRLLITPQPIKLHRLTLSLRQASGIWLPAVEAVSAGVAAPVKRLLQCISNLN